MQILLYATSVLSFVRDKMASLSKLLKLQGGEYLWPHTWGIIMALTYPNVGNISGPRHKTGHDPRLVFTHRMDRISQMVTRRLDPKRGAVNQRRCYDFDRFSLQKSNESQSSTISASDSLGEDKKAFKCARIKWWS